MKASVILDKVTLKLVDTGRVRWPVSTLVQYLNSGQRLIVEKRPDANTVFRAVQMVPGVVQTIPADAIAILNVTRNMGTDGATPGDVIDTVDRNVKDNFEPGWMKATASLTVEEFMPVSHSRTQFLVSPPVHASTAVYVEEEFSVYPVGCTDETSDIDVPDEYENILTDWVLSECMEMDTEASRKAQGQVLKQRVMSALGVKTQVDSASAPKHGDNRK